MSSVSDLTNLEVIFWHNEMLFLHEDAWGMFVYIIAQSEL